MEAFISQFGTFIAITTLLVAGGVAVYGLWDKKSTDRRKLVDNEEDRLITILTTTVQELEKKVDKQGQKIGVLSKKVDDLEKENETLIEVLQGRDEATKKFYSQVLAATETAKETNEYVKTIHEENKATNENIKELIHIMGKHVDVMGIQAQKG